MVLLAALAAARMLPAQTIVYPKGVADTAPRLAPSVPGVGTPAPGTLSPPTVSVPGSTVPGSAAPAAINPYTGAAAPFDPYSTSGSSAYQFWSNTPPSNSAGVFSQPPATPYGATSPLTPQGTAPLGQPGSFPTYGPPAASPYGQTNPQYLFPNGVGQQWDLAQSIRFIQDLRMRHTYVGGGDDPTDVGINDSEFAVTFTLPNFLTTGQPLFISPAFALHLWDGPSSLPADLPPNAYSAYLDAQWASDPNLQLGAELGFRVGVYTDFETLNDDSLRIQGLALGVARLTPTMTAKIGVMYLDRNNIKILPAGGLLWTPTPQVRFDIFFPQPKLACYLTTVGRYELWGYLAGEYGGGAWTIERADGTSDAIDINDIRFSGGFEWNGPRGLSGFVEAGFVFKRQVIYVVTPSDSFNPDDTFMVRAGLSF
jgi:hypothetical protein